MPFGLYFKQQKETNGVKQVGGISISFSFEFLVHAFSAENFTFGFEGSQQKKKKTKEKHTHTHRQHDVLVFLIVFTNFFFIIKKISLVRG